MLICVACLKRRFRYSKTNCPLATTYYPDPCWRSRSYHSLCDSGLPQLIQAWEKSVPPAVAGGDTVRMQNQQQSCKLIIDPPATAGGTDFAQRRVSDF